MTKRLLNSIGWGVLLWHQTATPVSAVGLCTDSLAAISMARGLIFDSKSRGTKQSTSVIDKHVAENSLVLVCVGRETSDPILQDIDTYRQRGATVARPTDWEDLKAQIRSTPDTIDQIFIDAHGTEDGTTHMPGIASFAIDSLMFRSLYRTVGELNLTRKQKGLEPVSLTLLQCHGASCARSAANLIFSSVTGSTTRTSVPQSSAERSLALDGGRLRIFLPVIHN